jgi:hypothetical protein
MELIFPRHNIGPIFWDEIAEVTSYRFMGTSKIRIVPRDSKALVKRLGTRQSLFPFHIATMYLPMSTEEFLAQVAAIRSSPPPPLP